MFLGPIWDQAFQDVKLENLCGLRRLTFSHQKSNGCETRGGLTLFLYTCGSLRGVSGDVMRKVLNLKSAVVVAVLLVAGTIVVVPPAKGDDGAVATSSETPTRGGLLGTFSTSEPTPTPGAAVLFVAGMALVLTAQKKFAVA